MPELVYSTDIIGLKKGKYVFASTLHDMHVFLAYTAKTIEKAIGISGITDRSLNAIAFNVFAPFTFKRHNIICYFTI